MALMNSPIYRWSPGKLRKTMALRNRGGIFHWRFKLDGHEYSGTTDLAATESNMTEAQEIEFAERRALRESGRPTPRIVIRRFVEAAKDFLDWAKANYQAPTNSHQI